MTRGVMRNRAWRSLCAAAVLLASAVAHAPVASAQAKDNVTFLLDWNYWPPQIPLIVAKEKGFFADNGLDVEMRQGQGSGSTSKIVGQGTYDFGHVNLAVAAQAIAKGADMKAIATIAHKGASALVFKESAEIADPKDIEGKRLGSTPQGSDSMIYPAFFEANNIDPEKVNIVNMPGDAKLGALLSGQIDALSGDGYYYIALGKQKGADLEQLVYADHGAPHIAYGIIAHRSVMKNKPDVTRRFLDAVLRGYRYTFDQTDEAIQIYLDVSGVSQTKQEVRTIWDGYRALFESKASKDKPLGWNTEEDWAGTIRILKENDRIDTGMPVNEYYTNEFLTEN